MFKKMLFVFFVCLGLGLFGQSQKQALPLSKYGDNLSKPLTSKERAFIDEVYGNYANKLVYNNPQRLLSFKNILRNRVVIKRYEKKDLSSLKRLSQVRLINSINTNLQRDYSFDVDSFNPLKYAFNFFSKNRTEYYRVDNTQYLITILPQH